MKQACFQKFTSLHENKNMRDPSDYIKTNYFQMKRILLTLILLIPLWAMAQDSSPVDKLFNKYANKEGFSTVNISGKLLSFVAKLDDSKSEEAAMLEKISGIRILSVENKELNNNLNFYKELETDGFFRNNNYESLMEITNKDEIVRFYGRAGDKGKLSELLLVVGGKDNTLISIRGVINPDDIGKITGSLDLDIKTK
jgi:hypothetical protein